MKKRTKSRRFRIGIAALAVVAMSAGLAAWIDFRGFFVMRTARTAMIDSHGASLATDLILPVRQSPPFPAAVIVHGSGPITRAELHQWARLIVPQGMAVAIYDKRGTGQSGGTYPTFSAATSAQRLQELADDASAVFEWLRAQPEIDPSRVGFIGGSQAGWIIPLAATGVQDVAFIVGISAPAVTFGEEDFYSKLTGDDPSIFVGLSDDEITQRLTAFAGPHGYDPSRTLAMLETPMLWVLGGSDRSVPTDLSIRNIEAVRQSNPLSHKILLYPTADHNIREAQTGKRIDYWPSVFEWLQRTGILSSSDLPS